jgi:hypothetical protein
MPQVTLYLTHEETAKLAGFMEKHHVNRHKAIKIAIRQMLNLPVPEFLTKC